MIKALKQETPIESSANPNLVSELRLTYRTTPEITLYQRFNSLHKKSIMLTEKYGDNTWIFQDYLKDIHWKLDFSKQPFLHELKAFTILYLSENTPQATYQVVSYIIKVLRETHEFKFTDFSVESLGTFYVSVYQCLLAFLDFIEFDMTKSRFYLERISEKAKVNTSSRPLPGFQSVLAFDDLLTHFIAYDLKQFPQYYPVVLWWKLTMIIPIRPIEFFTLKVHDFEETPTAYYIHIERSLKSHLKENKPNKIPLLSHFQISKEIYMLFISYINTINVGPEGYIFNTDGGAWLKYSREFMGRNVLINLLNKFFDEIVSKKYGYIVLDSETQDVLHEKEIEKITYGDTRHYAFLNLLLQGYNPYSIAQLGGHRSLNEQNHYYDGMTSFCTSKAYSLAFGHALPNNDSAPISISAQRIENLRKENLDDSSARSIPGGYCLSQNFPYECVSAECSTGECPLFVSNDLQAIKASQISIRQSMDRKVDLLKSILFKDPTDSTTREETCNGLQEDIIKLSRLLQNEAAIKGDST